MDVHPLRVGLATRPGDDVRRPEQRSVGDARDRTSVLPIGQERFAENILADPDLFNAFDLGIPKSGGLAFEVLQRQGQKGDLLSVELPERLLQSVPPQKCTSDDIAFWAEVDTLLCQVAPDVSNPACHGQ